MRTDPVGATDEVFQLAEGPVWDAARQRLLWVDILGGAVLAGVLDGDPLLAVRGDTAVECWRIVDPVLAAWRAGKVPLESYPAGSQGPDGWPA